MLQSGPPYLQHIQQAKGVMSGSYGSGSSLRMHPNILCAVQHAINDSWCPCASRAYRVAWAQTLLIWVLRTRANRHTVLGCLQEEPRSACWVHMTRVGQQTCCFPGRQDSKSLLCWGTLCKSRQRSLQARDMHSHAVSCSQQPTGNYTKHPSCPLVQVRELLPQGVTVDISTTLCIIHPLAAPCCQAQQCALSLSE
jgi:hypothetical protein